MPDYLQAHPKAKATGRPEGDSTASQSLAGRAQIPLSSKGCTDMTLRDDLVAARADNSPLVDGQVYRWRWADEERHQKGLRGWSTYHCKSQIAVVRKGRLFDTYWQIGSEPSWEHEIKPADVVLTFYADESWPTITDYNVRYYKMEDVASMQHPNSSRAPIYLRPGAVRNKDRILEEIDYEESKARSAISSAQHTLERMTEARNLVEAGKVDEVYL